MVDTETTAETPAEGEPKDKRRKYLTWLLVLLMENGKETLSGHAQDLVEERIGLGQFHDRMVRDMGDQYSHAAHLGRQLAGSTAPFGQWDMMFGQAVAALSSIKYLQDFVSDLNGQRYRDDDGNLKADPVLARAALYAGLALGVANAAWKQTVASERFVWHTTEDESTCDTCASRDGQEYTRDTCPSPGEDSECGARCRCWIETIDGETCFVLP